ncbi:MAG: Asp-tRNA(Asn)/Glu-tRNA(Gln) amidotransferase subunit GatC [Sandaracinaceae bacterium]|nr:Asp-tRNA(Asn)/Glu-tRNA(Gln) amidotransferase subunit GatC [Sandaracinaceae bacterium]
MSSLPITREQILRVAELSRIALTEEEIEQYARELTHFVDMLSVLDTIDKDGVPPTVTLTFDPIAQRDDKLEPSLPRDEALAMGPVTSDGGFAVPKILGGEG